MLLLLLLLLLQLLLLEVGTLMFQAVPCYLVRVPLKAIKVAEGMLLLLLLLLLFLLLL